MATIKAEYYRLNGGTWDKYYFKTTADMVEGLNGLNVIDVRELAGGSSTFNLTPNGIEDKTIKPYFAQLSGAGSSWRSLINVKGWTGSYASWQLIGPGGTSADDDLYFRSGAGASWRTPRKIFHSGNLTAGDIPTHSHSAATTSAAGFMSSADKTKLNGIATNATANTGTVTNVSAGTTQVSGLTMLISNGTSTPTITTSINNAANFRNAIGAGTSNFNGNYNSLTNKLTAGDNITIDTNNKISANVSGTWKQIYSGTSSALSKTSTTSISVPSDIYPGKTVAIEIRYGSNIAGIFTNKIVFVTLGYSTSYGSSKTHPRFVSFSDFDGQYLKNISVMCYVNTGTTSTIHFGYLRTLIGSFSGSNIDWTTQASDSINVYIGKIWVLE